MRLGLPEEFDHAIKLGCEHSHVVNKMADIQEREKQSLLQVPSRKIYVVGVRAPQLDILLLFLESVE